MQQTPLCAIQRPLVWTLMEVTPVHAMAGTLEMDWSAMVRHSYIFPCKSMCMVCTSMNPCVTVYVERMEKLWKSGLTMQQTPLQVLNHMHEAIQYSMTWTHLPETTSGVLTALAIGMKSMFYASDATCTSSKLLHLNSMLCYLLNALEEWHFVSPANNVMSAHFL